MKTKPQVSASIQKAAFEARDRDAQPLFAAGPDEGAGEDRFPRSQVAPKGQHIADPRERRKATQPKGARE